MRIAVLSAVPCDAHAWEEILIGAGHRVQRFGLQQELLSCCVNESFDCCVVFLNDVPLGQNVIDQLRRGGLKRTLVLGLIPPEDEEIEVEALRTGADGVLINTVKPPLALAYLEAIMRPNRSVPEDVPIALSPYEIDPFTQTVLFNERKVRLTKIEFRLLKLLVCNIGRGVSRNHLIESVWGMKNAEDYITRTVDTHLSRLRKKLDLYPENGFSLQNIHGFGYTLRRSR